jgi:hypothetical protein
MTSDLNLYVAAERVHDLSKKGSIIISLHRKLGEQAAITPPGSDSPPRPYNPPDFITCQHLQTILLQIKNHIAISSVTVRCYLIICEDFNQMLDPENQIQDDHLNNAKIQEAFETWPNFVPMKYINRNVETPVHWGMVDKYQGCAHEIQLNGDLIEALEKAPSVSNA